MASSVRVDGSFPDPGDSSTKGLVFAGGWGVEYDWALDRATARNQPRRLSAIGFPAPYDSNLEGALRGRGAFSAFLYLFRNGRYLRLQAATMTPDGPDAPTAPAWELPVDWTTFDAVLPGRGSKINFCYFFRGAQNVRFDWTPNHVSPGYPKFIGPEWHLKAGEFVALASCEGGSIKLVNLGRKKTADMLSCAEARWRWTLKML